MNIGILGTGVVGQTIGSKLVQLGHKVMLGSRDAANPNAVAWANKEDPHKESTERRALFGTFSDAADFGEILFNCTLGIASLDALRMAGEKNMKGKILVDTATPQDGTGDTWRLAVCNTDSLGEQIQRAFPETFVVKSLNTINCEIIVNPNKLSEQTDVFVSGDSANAKAKVAALLKEWFGWRSVIDLGDIRTSRSVEMYVALWRSLRFTNKSFYFNIKVVGM